MKQFIQIKLNTGHLYQVPTDVIAQNRAAFYHKDRSEEFPTLESAVEDTVGLFDDANEIREWALNNMDVSDLMRHAMLVRYVQPDLQEAWNEGEWTYHDAPALMGEFDGETIMTQPVELVMQTMVLSKQLCNTTVLTGADNKPYAAFVMIIGDQPILSSYITALKFVGDRITAQPSAANTLPI